MSDTKIKKEDAMFKRGDIVVDSAGLLSVVVIWKPESRKLELGTAKEIRYISDRGDKGPPSSFDDLQPYAGRIYTRDGRRFVSSGIAGVPKVGEWYLSGKSNNPVQRSDGEMKFTGFVHDRVLLLPVPDLEPEHEFKVGDWVRTKEGLAFKVDGINQGAAKTYRGHKVGYDLKALTKLPGRPLTTDDLMQALSGKKITVECHACDCKGVRGDLFTTLERAYGSDRVAIYHDNYSGPGSPWLARFHDGSIIFAYGVEGNIFVVEE